MKTVRGLTVAALCLWLGACASLTQEAPRRDAPAAGKALVTFVRQAIFFGDGVPVSIWDGERFIGFATAGTMFQYQAEPGEHLFLGNAENWTYAKGNLEPGRHYYVKVNIFPGVMVARAALGILPEEDPDLLKNLTSQTVVPDRQKEYEAAYRAGALEAINLFKNGGVSSFATMKPVAER